MAAKQASSSVAADVLPPPPGAAGPAVVAVHDLANLFPLFAEQLAAHQPLPPLSWQNPATKRTYAATSLRVVAVPLEPPLLALRSRPQVGAARARAWRGPLVALT